MNAQNDKYHTLRKYLYLHILVIVPNLGDTKMSKIKLMLDKMLTVYSRSQHVNKNYMFINRVLRKHKERKQ
jgi:hypothetical protein